MKFLNSVPINMGQRLFITMLVVLGAAIPFEPHQSQAAGSYDCSNIESLQVLHEDLMAQPDGGRSLFESLDELCQLAYIDATQIVATEVTLAAPSVEEMQSGLYAAPAGCTLAWVSARGETLLGFQAYIFRMDVHFCHNGTSAYSHSPSFYPQGVNVTYNWLGGSFVSNYAVGSGRYIQSQGSFENCPPVPYYPCTYYYPGAWIQTYGSGYWTGNAWPN